MVRPGGSGCWLRTAGLLVTFCFAKRGFPGFGSSGPMEGREGQGPASRPSGVGSEVVRGWKMGLVAVIGRPARSGKSLDRGR